ncbi:hypothetical protein HAX54_012670, partial [Datura stramonium]|nr:hypothetical protein [Datura stramonium]
MMGCAMRHGGHRNEAGDATRLPKRARQISDTACRVACLIAVSSMLRRTPHHAGRVLMRVPHRARSSATSHWLLRQECYCLA